MCSQESLSVYQALYRRHVKATFNRNLQEWLSETEVRQELERIKSLADQLMDQQNVAAAATMLSTQIMTILEDDYFHPGITLRLSDFLLECVKDLGACLRSESARASVRKDILQALLKLSAFYVEQEYYAPYEEMFTIILSQATSEERYACAHWIRARGLPGGRFARDYQGFLLDLEADTLTDEVFFQRARAEGAAKRIVQRLLVRGRLEEAIQEAVLLFANRPSLPEYLAVRSLAETLGGFEQVKPGLQAALSGSQQETSLLLEMALDEGHIDQELELLLGEQAARRNPAVLCSRCAMCMSAEMRRAGGRSILQN